MTRIIPAKNHPLQPHTSPERLCAAGKTPDRPEPRGDEPLMPALLRYVRNRGGYASLVNPFERFCPALKRWRKRLRPRALADIVGCYDGWYFAIEIGTEADRSANRRLAESGVRNAGGYYILISSLDEFKTWFEAFRTTTRR